MNSSHVFEEIKLHAINESLSHFTGLSESAVKLIDSKACFIYFRNHLPKPLEFFFGHRIGRINEVVKHAMNIKVEDIQGAFERSFNIEGVLWWVFGV